MTVDDAALALRHRPALWLDRAEPFPPFAIGWSVHRLAGPSPSCRHRIEPIGAVTVEYAIFYDWDIGHLYDLEHVWVHLGDLGQVLAVEASFHGQRLRLDAPMQGPRPILFAEPGKHAHWADAAPMQRQMGPKLAALFGPEAGGEGVHLGNPFAAAGLFAATALDHRLARRFLQARAFAPTFDFVPAPEPPLVPWPQLARDIPDRIAAILCDLPGQVPHLEAIFLDCGDTLIDEATEVKRPGTEVVLSADPIPGAVEAVRALHALGYPLALVADGPRESFENLLRPLGLWDLFAAHIISGEIGAAKPDRRMFDAAMARLGLTDPGRVVMAGNNLARDIAGANRAGLISLFVGWSRRRSHVPAESDQTPAHSIDPLGELVARIETIERGLADPPNGRFACRPGETVTAFALGALEERSFPGPVMRGQDQVDYRFVNGFTAVGDLPCRIATRAEVASRQVDFPGDFPVAALNLPGFSRRLDFSGFWHLPTRLMRLARTRLVPTLPGRHRFRLTTCGGVHLWADGALVVAFEPYVRNRPATTSFTLDLPAQGVDLVLRAEEMAERDTSFFVELILEGPDPIAAEIPGGADPATLRALMVLARDVHPTRTFFTAGQPMELGFSAPAPREVTVTARVLPSVHLSHLPAIFTADVVLAAGADRLTLGPGAALAEAYHPLSLSFAIGPTRVERQIALARLDSPAPWTLRGDLVSRKRQALEHLARFGEARIGKLLAKAVLSLPVGADPEDRAILDDTLAAINDRRDCADFVLVPLLWLLADHRDRLSPEDRARAEAAVLGFRYWMDQPGNDTMWFWSENHVLCFHVAEYLAGGLLPDRSFANSGLTGAQHRTLARGRLQRWLAAVLDHGLAEWNSAAYYPIDFIGLFALTHLAEPDLAAQAQQVLDRLFVMIALHGIGGVAAGTMGRAYDKELRAGPLNELAPFLAVAFGRGWLGNGVAATPMFAAGDYVPPSGIETLAAPAPGTAVEARYVQGFGTAARLALWKTAGVQLSAAIDAAPGTAGHQQHLIDVQFAAAPFARLWINHPGEDDPWGSNRPSYWAGNGVMPRVGLTGDTALVLFDLGAAPELPFTHAFAPLDQFDEVRRGPTWLLLRSGSAWVLVAATGPLVSRGKGPGHGLEHHCQGAVSGWLVRVGECGAHHLDAVEADARGLVLDLSGTVLTATEPGQAPLILDWDKGLSRGGVPLPFPTLSRNPVLTFHRRLSPVRTDPVA